MQTAFPSPLQEATQSLIDHLLASEAFLRYQNACAQFNEHNDAQALLNQLTESQAKLRKKQGQGNVNQAEVDALRLLQQRAQCNPIIMAYTQSQQEAIHFLREINDEISQFLGINFASFANHPTC